MQIHTVLSGDTTPTLVTVSGPVTGISNNTVLDVYIQSQGTSTLIGTATVAPATPGGSNGQLYFSTTVPADYDPTTNDVVVYNGTTQVTGLTVTVASPLDAARQSLRRRAKPIGLASIGRLIARRRA